MEHYKKDRGDYLKPKRKMLIKLLGMMLAVTFTILCIGQAKPVYAADTGTQLSVSIGAVSGKPGETVEVPVDVANVPAAGINNFNFVISYDTTALDLVYKVGSDGKVITDGDLPVVDVDMADTKIPSVADFSCSESSYGMLNFLYDDDTQGSNPINTSGTLFKLKFKIKDTAQPGDYAVHQLDYSEGSYLGTIFSINDSSSPKGITNVNAIFNPGKVTVLSGIDIAKLNSEITNAEDMAAIPVGTNPGNCSSQTAMDELKAAIASAKTVAGSTSPTQQAIDDAYEALVDAESKVEDAIIPELTSDVGSVTENSNFDQKIQIGIKGTGDFTSNFGTDNIKLGGDFQGLTVVYASQDPTNTFKANIELKGVLKCTTGTGTITVNAAGWSGPCAPCDLTASIKVVKAGTALAVVSSAPSKDATNVPVDSPITVKFNQGIKPVDTVFNGITLIDNSTNTPVDTTNTIISDTLTIVPKANLKNSTTYTVSIPVGAISDTSGTQLASAYTFSFTTVAISSNLQVTISKDKIVRPGNSVEVDVTLDNIPASGLLCNSFALQFDNTNFSLLSSDITTGSIINNSGDLKASVVNDKIYFVYNYTGLDQKGITQPGIFAKLIFKANSTAAVGSYPVKYTQEDAEDFKDCKGNTINTSFTDGNIIVKNVIYGDVDGNGKVTSWDLQLVIKYLLKLSTLDQNGIAAADVDGNGKITSWDSQLMTQYLLKLISSFPVEGK